MSVNAILENYDERIRDLEKERVEFAVNIAEISTTLKIIQHEISELNQSIKDNNIAVQSIIDKSMSQRFACDKRMEHLEVSENKRKERSSFINTAIKTLIVGGLGSALGFWIQKLIG